METSSQRIPQLPGQDSTAKLELRGNRSRYISNYKNKHTHFPAQSWVFPRPPSAEAFPMPLFEPEKVPRATSGNPPPTSREHRNGIADMPNSVAQNAPMPWDSLQMVPGNNTMEEHLENMDSETWNSRGVSSFTPCRAHSLQISKILLADKISVAGSM